MLANFCFPQTLLFPKTYLLTTRPKILVPVYVCVCVCVCCVRACVRACVRVCVCVRVVCA